MPEAFNRMTPDQVLKAAYELSKFVLPGGMSKTIDFTKKGFEKLFESFPEKMQEMQKLDYLPASTQKYIPEIAAPTPKAQVSSLTPEERAQVENMIKSLRAGVTLR
jgi:hypothetical protein